MIKELIVVEGVNDTKRLQSFFDVDTIETHGMGLSKEKGNKSSEAEKVSEQSGAAENGSTSSSLVSRKNSQAIDTDGEKENESSEWIDVLLADRQEVRRILAEEKTSVRAAFLMHTFLKNRPEEPFAFLEG